MNACMVPKAVLDVMAKFPVGNIMVESHEITLLGEAFNDVVSLSKKDFWKHFRRVSRALNSNTTDQAPEYLQ